MTDVLKSPEVADRLKSLGGEPRPTSPDQATEFIRDEIRSVGTLMRKLDIRITD